MADDYTSDADDLLEDFVEAAREVIKRWEHGDLASAVSTLSALIDEYDAMQEDDTDDGTLDPEDIPADFPVQPLSEGDMTCGTCGLSWDDSISTSLTPAPSGRCPFESFHR